MSKDSHYKGFATKAIHAGQEPDPHSGALMVPISMSSTFAQKNVGERYPGGYEYSRSGNPTRDVRVYKFIVIHCIRHSNNVLQVLKVVNMDLHFLLDWEHKLVLLVY